jgi:NAD(P)-dependent dehydrogenase (short-subunit alcohol dehydrogenase family)
MTALSGKTALVTGASRGVGRASALALAKAGAQVLVHYGSGVKEAEAVVAQIRKAGGRADAIAADLAAPDGPHRLAKRVRAIVGDRLDILVADAGISKAATIEETTVETLTNSSPSMSGRPSSSYSSFFRYCRKAAALSSSRHSRRGPRSGRSPLTERQKAPSIRW